MSKTSNMLELPFLLQYFICLLSRTVFAAMSNFILSGVTFRWHAAIINERYSFASPNLNFEKSSIVDIGSFLNDKNETWIGYFQMETTFEYYGCTMISDRVPSQTLTKSWNTPGICFSVCNGMAKKIFGLNDNKCFCLDDAPSTDIHKPECDNNNYTNWVAGGGDKFISLYRKIDVNFTEANSSPKDVCFTFFKENQYRKTQWKDCAGSNKCICVKDGRGFPVDNHSQWHFRWTEYVKKCFEHGYTPVSYQDVQNSSLSFENATSYSWTNIIRSQAIFKYKEYVNDSKAKEYAYLKWEGKHIALYFTGNYGLLKQALFIEDTIETTKTEILITSQKPMSKSDFSVPIGVSVSVLAVIIVVVVIAIVAVKKRGGIHNICAKTGNSNETLTTISTVHNAVENVNETSQEQNHKICNLGTNSISKSGYGLDLEQEQYTNKNNVFESSQDPYNEIGDIGTRSKANSVDGFDLEKEQYTHTYAILEPHTKESDENIAEHNSFYNTLDSRKSSNRKNKSDETYDTTEKAAAKLKIKTSLCDTDEKSNLVCNEEDTYNHINSKDHLKTKTDNVYGMSNAFGSEYGAVRAKQGNETGENAYSHAN